MPRFEPSQLELKEKSADLLEEYCLEERLIWKLGMGLMSQEAVLSRLEYLRVLAERDAPYRLRDEFDEGPEGLDEEAV